MNQQLKKYDEMLRKLDNGFKYNYLLRVQSPRIWLEKNRKFLEAFGEVAPNVVELLPTLSANEIAHSYIEGCDLLRECLVFHMYSNFDKECLPVIRFSIENDHEFAWRLFASLPSYDENIDDLVIQLSKSRWFYNVEMALNIILHSKLIRFRWLAEKLTTHGTKAIAGYALEVLEKLDSQ